MADKKLMIDSTVLIDFFRKTDKSKARLTHLFNEYDLLFISAVTEFEVLSGVSALHMPVWNGITARIIVLDFDSIVAKEAARIVSELKSKRKTMDKPDLFIAATACIHGLLLDTANKKHFQHIDALTLLTD